MENHRILVIDYDLGILEFMREALLSEGYEVVTCEEPVATFGYIQYVQPDLVILDLLMINSPETLLLLEQLRNDSLIKAIPVLITSTDEHLLQALAEPLHRMCCTSLMKPFSLELFFDHVSHLLTLSEPAICRAQTVNGWH